MSQACNGVFRRQLKFSEYFRSFYISRLLPNFTERPLNHCYLNNCFSSANEDVLSEFLEEMYTFNLPDIRSWMKEGSLPYIEIDTTTNG